MREMGGKDRRFYARLVLGVGCVAAGVALGQAIDQRLTLVAMFPAVALLSGVIAELTAPRPPKVEPAPELSPDDRELLAAVWNHGGLTPARAAEKTSLPEPEAARRLSELAGRGYLLSEDRGDSPVYNRAGRPD